MAEQKKRRKKGEGSIFKRGNKFVAEYCGKTVYADTSSEITDKLNQLKADVAAGYTALKNPTVKETFTKWLAMKKLSLKAQSYQRIESTVNTHIIPMIGMKKIQEVTGDDFLADVLTPLKESGLSYSSVKKVFDAMNACCRYAAIKKEIKFNPLDSIEPPSEKSFGVSDSEYDVHFLSEEECKQLITACNMTWSTGAKKYQNSDAYVVMLNTGLRAGEMLSLKWNNVDFANNTLSIKEGTECVKDNNPKSPTHGKYVFKSVPYTKNSRPRKVPLNKTALARLNALKEWQNQNDIQSDYVVSNKNGDIVLYSTFLDTFKRVCSAAGIELPSNTELHVLRHTFASILFRRGVDVKMISDILGHSSVKITMDIYVHLIQEQNIKAVRLMEEIDFS